MIIILLYMGEWGRCWLVYQMPSLEYLKVPGHCWCICICTTPHPRRPMLILHLRIKGLNWGKILFFFFYLPNFFWSSRVWEHQRKYTEFPPALFWEGECTERSTSSNGAPIGLMTNSRGFQSWPKEALISLTKMWSWWLLPLKCSFKS